MNVPLKVVDVDAKFERRPVVPLSRGCETACEPRGTLRSLLDITDIPIELVASHISLHMLFVRACFRQFLKLLFAVVFLSEGRTRRHAEGALYQAASCPSQDAGAATCTRDQRHAMASIDGSLRHIVASASVAAEVNPCTRRRRLQGEVSWCGAPLRFTLYSRSQSTRPSKSTPSRLGSVMISDLAPEVNREVVTSTPIVDRVDRCTMVPRSARTTAGPTGWSGPYRLHSNAKRIDRPCIRLVAITSRPPSLLLGVKVTSSNPSWSTSDATKTSKSLAVMSSMPSGRLSTRSTRRSGSK